MRYSTAGARSGIADQWSYEERGNEGGEQHRMSVRCETPMYLLSQLAEKPSFD
jgi:hypothetical protein